MNVEGGGNMTVLLKNGPKSPLVNRVQRDFSCAVVGY